MQHLPNKDRAKKPDDKSRQEVENALSREFKDKMVMLTIAYHNLGAEKEYLRNVSIIRFS